MSYTVNAPSTMMSKGEKYQEVIRDAVAVLDGEPDITARMATVVSLLDQAFDSWFWTGFYVVDKVKKSAGIDELVVGPYNGTLGCLRIAFGRGVCGAAAATGQTQVVPDVHAFADHIACDSRANSEIVVPVFNATGELIAVFDSDSESFGAYDAEDAENLEKLLKAIFAV